MASQTAAIKSKEQAVPVEIKKGDRQLADRANDAVASRAYALFLAAGAADGQDLANWLQAESEVLSRIPEIRDSSSWFTVNVPLPAFSADQIQVSVSEENAIIAADKTQNADGRTSKDGASTRESMFLVANWPSAVDPSTASAYLKDGGLTLTVRRADAKK